MTRVASSSPVLASASSFPILNAFINQVEAQPEKIIASGTASTLIADATQIRAVLGC